MGLFVGMAFCAQGDAMKLGPTAAEAAAQVFDCAASQFQG